MNRCLLRCVLTVASAMAVGVAQAATCPIGTISSTQYEQLRSRLLGSKGALTQSFCSSDPANADANSCEPKGGIDDLSHSGIDYGRVTITPTTPVPVYSPMDGVVTYVQPGTSCVGGGTCLLSWLTVYNVRANVTFAFLHMETIAVGVGAEIVTGQQVGTVGKRGVPRSAEHVHYEVRTSKLYSSAPCINVKVVNPYVNSPWTWEFNVANNVEGWTGTNLTSLKASGPIPPSDAVLLIDPAGLDPFVSGPPINADAATFKRVRFRMASNALDKFGAIYFKTAASNSFGEAKRVPFTVKDGGYCRLCGNAPYADYDVDMSGNLNWTGTITGLRLDPANAGQSGTADTIGLQYLMLSP